MACSDGDISGDSQTPDPSVVDFPIAFVQRSLPVDEDGQLETADPREPFTFNADTIVDLPEPGMPVRQTISFAKMKLFTDSSL